MKGKVLNHFSLIVVFLLLNVAGLGSSLDAGTIHVPGDEAAIAAALAAADAGDQIILAAQTFTESSLTVNKSLTIEGQGPAFTIVQAHVTESSATARVLTISAGKTVTLKNMTIRHGKDSDNSGARGILSDTGSDHQSMWNISRSVSSFAFGLSGEFETRKLVMRFHHF